MFGKFFSVSKKKKVEDGIFINFYGKYENQFNSDNEEYFIYVQNYDTEYVSEELCLQIAQRLDICSIAFPTFALVNADSKLWLPPNEKIVCEKNVLKEYNFRIRFFPDLNNFYKLCPKAFKYLFHQMRHDFINGTISLHKSHKEEELLGLSLLDMFYFAKFNNNNNIEQVDIMQFIPKKLIKITGIIENNILKKNLKKAFDKYYKDQNSDETMKSYVTSLKNYSINYEKEEFDGKMCDMPVLISVNPYDKFYPGINIKDKENKYHIKFKELENINILLDTCMVQINNKKGQPRFIKFENVKIALSFVALLDGYYRLSEDYHYHLCDQNQITSPYLARINKIRCHGPVKKDWSITTLKKYNMLDSKKNYLIRLSTKKFNTFVIVHMPVNNNKNKPVGPNFYEISQSAEDGKYHLNFNNGIETKYFEMVEDLIEYYKQPLSPLTLHKTVAPFKKNTGDESIYICSVKESLSELNILSSILPDRPCLIQYIETNRRIGEGCYTNIFLGNADDFKNVVIKRLKADSGHILQYFQESIHRFAFCDRTNTILLVHGICLYPHFSAVLEFAPRGDLLTFLKQNSNIKVAMLIKVAEQVAQALAYISEKNLIHSNIRCRNVMVMRYESDCLNIKLSDPGLAFYYNSLPLDHQLNIERLPWIAPECLNSSLNELSSFSDMYSFGICLWEVFSNGDQPYMHFKKQQIIDCANSGEGPGSPYNPEIFDLMKRCWYTTPDERPSPLEVVKFIRSFNFDSLRSSNQQSFTFSSSSGETVSFATTTDSQAPLLRNKTSKSKKCLPFTADLYSGSTTLDGVSTNTQQTDVPGVISQSNNNSTLPMEDLKFNGMKIIESIGEGLFGEVFKAETRDDNGLIITVAIKYLKKEQKNNQSCKEFSKELEIMQKLEHPNIVKVLYRNTNPNNANGIIMEYIKRGSLKKLLSSEKDYFRNHIKELVKYSLDISQGMKYLAGERIVHRDLAVRNILITDDCVAKISDFGLSRILDPAKNYYKICSLTYLPAFQFAPECLSQNKFDEKTDVWSFGVTLWEMFSLGEKPELTKDTRQILKLLEEGKRLVIRDTIPPNVYGVMNLCWNFEAAKRPLFADLVDIMTDILVQF